MSRVIVGRMNGNVTAAAIGARITQARQNKGLSQEKLAAVIHTSRRNVLRWEGGYNTPRAEHLEAIARATDTTVGFLLASDDDEEEDSLAADLVRFVRSLPVGLADEFHDLLSKQKRRIAPLALALGLIIPAAAAAQLAPRPAVVEDADGLGECRQGEYQRVETVLGTYYCMGPPVGPWFWRFVPS